jgi:YhcH/YjgK/YiaL family protein
MITDTLAQGHRYASLNPRFAAAFEFLKQLPADQPIGRYELDGDNCFALVQTYTTKPAAQGTFESHQRYIDIQFIQAGVETLLWAPLATLQVTQPYAAEKDVALYAMPARSTPINLTAGEFTIFFPEDGHAPGLASGCPSTVRKVVIKVRA